MDVPSFDFLRAVALALALVGCGLLGQGLWNAVRSLRAARWPTAPATISGLTLREASDDDGTTWQVVVHYSYTVDGVPYPGSRIAFGYGSSSGRGSHEAVRGRLAGATSVAVRYNPANPSVSCLSCGLHRSILFALVGGVAVLVLAAGVALHAGGNLAGWRTALHGALGACAVVLLFLALRGDPVLVDRLIVE